MMELKNNPQISFYEPTKEFLSLNSKEKILMDTDLFKQISLTNKNETINYNFFTNGNNQVQVKNENYFGVQSIIEPIEMAKGQDESKFDISDCLDGSMARDFGIF